MRTPTVTTLTGVCNIAGSAIRVENEALLASTSVSASSTLRFANLFTSAVPNLTHVGWNTCLLVRVELVAASARTVVSAFDIDASVGATSVMRGTFIIINTCLLVFGEGESGSALAEVATERVTAYLVAATVVCCALVEIVFAS